MKILKMQKHARNVILYYNDYDDGFNAAFHSLQLYLFPFAYSFEKAKLMYKVYHGPSSPAKVSSYLPFDKPFASRPSKIIISADLSTNENARKDFFP